MMYSIIFTRRVIRTQQQEIVINASDATSAAREAISLLQENNWDTDPVETVDPIMDVEAVAHVGWIVHTSIKN